MYKKRIKDNSISKNLCVLTFEESQDVFGIFSNLEMEEDYKTRVMRSELRGIDFEPIYKEFSIDHQLLELLKKQYQEFSSVFYLFRDVYVNMQKICLPRVFSTPYYVEELSCPISDYLFVFNDENPKLENSFQYTLQNYQDFIALNDYPKNIIKVNDSILRSKLAEFIDIERLKSDGLVRENFEGDIFQNCLDEEELGRLSNKYFQCVSQAHKDYMFVKNKVEGFDYVNDKLAPYESEYFILKDLRINGELFNRDDFTIDRLIVSKSGIYVTSLVNWDDNFELYISADNKWSVKNELKEKQIINPTESNLLNCIAVKQILRTTLSEEILDRIPIVPLIIVANENKIFINESQNQVIRGNELYLTISKDTNFLNNEQEQLIANTLYSYNIEKEKLVFPIYLQDLESVKSVYEDIYYNHINVCLPKMIELLWKVKKEDYYQGQIKRKKLSSITIGLSAALILIGLIINCICFNNLTYPVIFLYSCLSLVLASASYFDYQFALSWKEGEKSGECFEVKRGVFAFGGLLSLLAVSGIFTFLLITVQNII